MRAFVEIGAKAQSDAIVERYTPTVTERVLGSVPVLDVIPKGWKDNSKLAVYVHGEAHTLCNAASTLDRAAIFADDTGQRVISVDYTLAPAAKYNQMSDEVIAVIQALMKEGHPLKDIVIYGDSLGGGLAAAVILKMRDRGRRLPAAAVLMLPGREIRNSH